MTISPTRRFGALHVIKAAALLSAAGCSTLHEASTIHAHADVEGVRAGTVITARAEFAAEATVTAMINGQPLPVRVGPGRPSVLQLRAADALVLFGPLAAQYVQRGDWMGAQRATERIGPVTVRGHRAFAGLTLAGGNVAAPVHWFGQEESASDAAQVGPFGIPAAIVRFQLRAAQSNERTYTLPLDEEVNGWGIASTSLSLDRRRVRFAFAPHFATSIVSAAAGGAMAQMQGGRFLGPPQPVLISHGVSRPARPARLDRPLAVGPVMLSAILVRTLDYGAAQGIGELTETLENPADILVTARTDRQSPQFIVYLGADALSHCSSVTFDKPAMTVSLTCTDPLHPGG